MSKFRLLSLTVGLCSSVLFAASRDIESTKLRNAVQKSVDLMQKCGPIFIKNGACTSCHHQSVPAMAIAAARQKGFRIDERIARQQLQAMAAFMNARRERYLQVIDPGGSADTVGYTLLGMAADKYAPDEITGAMIYYLKATQASDGHWHATAHRPPLEYSNITATATSIRAIQIFAPEEERAEYQKRVQRAAAWLLEAPARANEERVFKLLGLGWAKADPAAVDKAARELLAGQNVDGGWSQFPTLASDAYATGQTLIALHQAGALPVSDAAYQKGIRFLLNTQLEDGSWLVKTRTLPLQPYFESGFPHGPDQWISSTGTAWATMALALAADPVQLSSQR
jgi:N-acyl-D-amino-acid deacylase